MTDVIITARLWARIYTISSSRNLEIAKRAIKAASIDETTKAVMLATAADVLQNVEVAEIDWEWNHRPYWEVTEPDPNWRGDKSWRQPSRA